jgi:bifunctional ADP-heptose synthase (sugar kinase/adenylyltransferase)
VESGGGRVVIVPLSEGHSTTATIARLRAADE